MALRDRLLESGRRAAARAREKAQQRRDGIDPSVLRARAVERARQAGEAIEEFGNEQAPQADDGRAVAARAEQTAAMAPPVDATLDPTASPTHLEGYATGGTAESSDGGDLDAMATVDFDLGFGGEADDDDAVYGLDFGDDDGEPFGLDFGDGGDN